jgi:hypothetical protein
MKRAFHFRLERIQKVRELLENQARAAVLAARAELEQASAKVAAAEAAIEAAREAERQTRATGQLDIAAQLASESAYPALRHQRAKALQLEQAARERLDLATLEHQAAQRDQKALERLSQRDAQGHAQALAQLEAAEAEERSQLRPNH